MKNTDEHGRTRIYVASSWRNNLQPSVVEALRGAGFNVYDFRNPDAGDRGFAWSDIDPNWCLWTIKEFVAGLSDPFAIAALGRDMTALDEADVCVLVLPCGRSAHLEAGFAAGRGKTVLIYHPPGVEMEPELMYGMTRGVFADLDALIDEICEAERRKRRR